MERNCKICGEIATGRCGKCYGIFCGIHMVDTSYGHGSILVCLDCSDKIKRKNKNILKFMFTTFTIILLISIVFLLVFYNIFF